MNLAETLERNARDHGETLVEIEWDEIGGRKHIKALILNKGICRFRCEDEISVTFETIPLDERVSAPPRTQEEE